MLIFHPIKFIGTAGYILQLGLVALHVADITALILPQFATIISFTGLVNILEMYSINILFNINNINVYILLFYKLFKLLITNALLLIIELW